jgi:uncharacterized protein YciI
MMTTLLLLLLGTAVSAQQAPKIDEYKMTTYQLVILKKSSMWLDAEVVNGPMNRKRHRDYVGELVMSGRLAIGGLFSENANLEGAYFVSGTPEEARAIASADPTSAWWDVDVLQWMGPEGWFQKPPDPAQTETIYFGFLVTGENVAPVSQEEQKTLMTGHLGYMDGQAKIGALVLAGPLIKAAPRRGLIAYRLPTMAAAVERASGDPMIEAGRMKPELYAWTIPRGILK